jgi:hypothetical protein
MSERDSRFRFHQRNIDHYQCLLKSGFSDIECLHTTKAVGLPRAREHGELYDGVA